MTDYISDTALGNPGRRYHAIFAAMNHGVVIAELVRDAQGRVVDARHLEINAAYEAMTGLTADQVIGRTGREVTPEAGDELVAIFEAVVRTGQPAHQQIYLADLGRWVNQYAFSLGNDQYAIVFSDITERKLAEDELRTRGEQNEFLLRLSDALRPLSDAVEIQETITLLAMNHFGADRSYYGEIDGDVVTIRRDASQLGLPSVAAVYSLSKMPIFKAVAEAGQPIVVPDVATSDRMDEVLKQLCIQMKILSYINVPVIKGGQMVGNFCLTQCKPRVWTEVEVDLAAEIAERAWAAVERARAEQTVRTREEEQRFLLHLGDTLRSRSSEIDTLQTAARLLGEFLDADRAFFGELFQEENLAIMLPDYARGELPSLVGSFKISDFQETVDALQGGQPIVIDDVAHTQLLTEATRSAYLALGYASFFSVPLLSHGRLNLNLSVVSGQARHWTPSQIRLTQAVAQRTWTMVERVRAEESLRESEERLRLITDNLPALIAYHDRAERYLFANKPFESFFGVPREQILGKTIRQIINETLYARLQPGIKAVVAGRQVRFEVKVSDSSDPQRAVWMEQTYIPDFALDGTIEGFYMLAVDISERKRTELAEQHQRQLAETLRDTEVTLTTTLKPEEVLERAVALGRRVMNYGAAYIILIEDGHFDPTLNNFRSDGLTEQEQQALLRWHQRRSHLKSTMLYRQAAQTHQPVLMDLTAQRKRLPPIRPSTSTLLVLPLLGKARILGFMTLIDVQLNADGAGDAELLAIEAFAYQVVSAISNAQQFIQVQELAAFQERQQLARDLHDAVIQSLFSASVLSETLPTLMRQKPETIPVVMGDITRLLKGASAELRTLVLQLRPNSLQSTPFTELVRHLITAIQGRKNIEIFWEFEGEPTLPAEVHLAVYRIAQEVLNNINKHSQATKMWITGQGEAGAITLNVRDNGRGFSLEGRSTGLGLQMMRERANEIGGALTIQSKLGEGTDVHIAWPVSTS